MTFADKSDLPRLRTRLSITWLDGLHLRCLALSLLVLMALSLSAHAQDVVGSDSHAYGQKIRLSSVTLSGDRYATVTGRILMDGTLDSAVVLFSDVPGLPRWIDNLATVQEVKTRSITDRQLYMRFSAPAGFEDRDGLMRFVAKPAGTGVVHLSMVGVDGFPEQPQAVRMKDMRGRFRFEQVAPQTLAVEFKLHYDSSAEPVKLANLSVKSQVKQTLLSMQRLIEGPLKGVSANRQLAQRLGL